MSDGEKMKLKEIKKQYSEYDGYDAIIFISTTLQHAKSFLKKFEPYVEFLDVGKEDSYQTAELKCELIANGYKYLEELESIIKYCEEELE